MRQAKGKTITIDNENVYTAIVRAADGGPIITVDSENGINLDMPQGHNITINNDEITICVGSDGPSVAVRLADEETLGTLFNQHGMPNLLQRVPNAESIYVIPSTTEGLTADNGTIDTTLNENDAYVEVITPSIDYLGCEDEYRVRMMSNGTILTDFLAGKKMVIDRNNRLVVEPDVHGSRKIEHYMKPHGSLR